MRCEQARRTAAAGGAGRQAGPHTHASCQASSRQAGSQARPPAHLPLPPPPRPAQSHACAARPTGAAASRARCGAGRGAAAGVGPAWSSGRVPAPARNEHSRHGPAHLAASAAHLALREDTGMPVHLDTISAMSASVTSLWSMRLVCFGGAGPYGRIRVSRLGRPACSLPPPPAPGGSGLPAPRTFQPTRLVPSPCPCPPAPPPPAPPLPPSAPSAGPAACRT